MPLRDGVHCSLYSLWRAGFVALYGLLSLNVGAADCREQDGNESFPDIRLVTIAEGLNQPVHLAQPTGEKQRLYVVEQAGVVRLIEQDRLVEEPFLDVRERVSSGGEKGLLSIAFHPDYQTNGLFYLNYTSSAGGLHTVVAEYRGKNKRRADSTSERVLLEIAQPFGNHNGGQLAFGPDGYLYIGMGDGGWANDPLGHGQNTTTLLGALLRIDVNHASEGHHYAVPKDNPYAQSRDVRSEIWAYGLRNPWRFSFDRVTGDVYLADVGQDTKEEINVIRQGGNYGWNVMEGDVCTPDVNKRCDPQGMEAPIHTYSHPSGFSVTGGFVYRGQAIPQLCGAYLFADYVNKQIWALRHDGRRVTRHEKLLVSPDNPSSFGEDGEGELYVLGHREGRVMKIVAD